MQNYIAGIRKAMKVELPDMTTEQLRTLAKRIDEYDKISPPGSQYTKLPIDAEYGGLHATPLAPGLAVVDAAMVGMIGADGIKALQEVYSALDGATDEPSLKDAAQAISKALSGPVADALLTAVLWGAGRAAGKNAKNYEINPDAANGTTVGSNFGNVLRKRGPKTFIVGPHGEMPSPRGGNESHHGIMSRWMDENFTNYNPDKAPAVLMDFENHNATRREYNAWKSERGGEVDWSKVSEVEIRKLSERLFDAAEVPSKFRAAYYKLFDAYRKTLTKK